MEYACNLGGRLGIFLAIAMTGEMTGEHGILVMIFAQACAIHVLVGPRGDRPRVGRVLAGGLWLRWSGHESEGDRSRLVKFHAMVAASAQTIPPPVVVYAEVAEALFIVGTMVIGCSRSTGAVQMCSQT